jgi:hypothetical protein
VLRFPLGRNFSHAPVLWKHVCNPNQKLKSSGAILHLNVASNGIQMSYFSVRENSKSAGVWERIKEAFHKEPPKARLSEQQVVKIAESYLSERGEIPLRQPIGVSIIIQQNEFIWHICDLERMRGGNFHMHIADATGQIVKNWSTPTQIGPIQKAWLKTNARRHLKVPGGAA